MRRRIVPMRVTPKGIQARLSKPVPWRPMTDAEWDDIQFIFAWLHPDRGRPLASPRLALDACFHAACSGKPWRELPPVFGKWQTIHRLFVRWTHKGAWTQLLKFVASRSNSLPESLTYWVCRAFRRAKRILGIPGYVLARRLGMDSALPAPSWWLPDPDLGIYTEKAWIPRFLDCTKRLMAKGDLANAPPSPLQALGLRPPPRWSLRRWVREEHRVVAKFTIALHNTVIGYKRLKPHSEPENTLPFHGPIPYARDILPGWDRMKWRMPDTTPRGRT